jgi:hypothetical protein
MVNFNLTWVRGRAQTIYCMRSIVDEAAGVANIYGQTALSKLLITRLLL